MITTHRRCPNNFRTGREINNRDLDPDFRTPGVHSGTGTGSDGGGKPEETTHRQQREGRGSRRRPRRKARCPIGTSRHVSPGQ
eukprot:1362027-Prymnesium_polylepis.2